MCAKFGCRPTVFSKKKGGTDIQTKKTTAYIVDINLDHLTNYRYMKKIWKI